MTDDTDTPKVPLSEQTLDSLERYAVQGPAALNDPVVAESLQGRSGLVARLGTALAIWRAVPSERTEASLATMLSRLQVKRPGGVKPKQPRTAVPWMGRAMSLPSPLWRVLAVSAVLAGIVVGFMLGSRSAPPAETVARTYATAGGQRAQVTLSDGTRMSLAPATTVDVLDGFGGRSRTVVVHGAALFDVAQSAGAPFIVRAGSSVTRVLGTKFVVRRYSDESAARITVVHGKVSVRSTLSPRRGAEPGTADEAIVTAGAMALCADSGAITLLPNVAINDYEAPYEGRLVFRGTPLRDVAAELSRTYGVAIRVTDSALAARRLTFTTTVDAQSLDGILAALVAAVPPAHIERRQGTVLIVAGRRTSTSLAIPQSMTPEMSYGR